MLASPTVFEICANINLGKIGNGSFSLVDPCSGISFSLHSWKDWVACLFMTANFKELQIYATWPTL